MTRSHHSSTAIHIADDAISIKRSWCNLIQNVYRRSLSSGPETRKPKFPSIRDPQGLRRPRFSFFIFTCQTARGEHPSPTDGSLQPLPTANHNRLLPAVESLIIVRSFTGAETCVGRGPMQCRAQWPGYRPAHSSLSTPVVNKSSHRVEIFAVRWSRVFSGRHAVLEPQSCDVLTYA